MSRFIKRVDQLVRRTHRFIPRERIEAIVNSAKLQLEIIEKLPGLKHRVREIHRLIEEYARKNDAKALEKLEESYRNDEEARLTCFIQFWESKCKKGELGCWYTKETGEKLLELAQRSERIINERREEEERRSRRGANQIS